MDLLNVFIMQGILCVVALAVEAFLHIRFYIKGMDTKAKLLSTISDKVNALPPCIIDNIDDILGLFQQSKDPGLIKAFRSFKNDAEFLLHNEAAPEASVYFSHESVYSIPNPEFYKSLFQIVTVAMGLIVAAAPPAWIMVYGTSIGVDPYPYLAGAFGVSLIGVIWIMVVRMIFVMYEKKSQIAAIAALESIESSLRHSLPTAGNATQIALLMDSAKQTKDSFSESAGVIVRRIDSLVVNSIAPMVAGAFEKSIIDHVTPVFNSINMTISDLSTAILEKQENGMRQLANNFSEHLYETMESKIKLLADNVGVITERLSDTTSEMKSFAEIIKQGLREDRETLDDATALSLKIAGVNKLSSDRMAEFSDNLKDVKSIMESLGDQVDKIFFGMEQSAKQNAGIIQEHEKWIQESREDMTKALNLIADAPDVIKDAYEQSHELFTKNLTESGNVINSVIDAGAQQMEKSIRVAIGTLHDTAETNAEILERSARSTDEALSKTIASNNLVTTQLVQTMDILANMGTEQFEKTMRAANSLLDNILTEMNKAMAGLGLEIVEGIGKASGESAQIVERLAVQLSALKEEYDTYFTRIEEQNRNVHSEMDFHIQNIISRFVQESENIVMKLQDSISSTMTLFTENTTSVITSIDDQSRNMGLLAKEISLDVSSLSSSLRGSVAEFSEHLHNGVVNTFDDFDAGLSEVSKRLAGTVESIRDSVENLPRALATLDRG